MNRRIALLTMLIVSTATTFASLGLSQIKKDDSATISKGTTREKFKAWLFVDKMKVADKEETVEAELPFLLFEPTAARSSKQEKYPLVVCLHDGGKRKARNGEQFSAMSVDIARDESQAQHPCFVLVPNASGDWGEIAWKKQAQTRMPAAPNRALAMTLKLTEELIKDPSRKIDPDRIYLSGAGMGGAGVLEAAARRPDLFAAVLAENPDTYRDVPEGLKLTRVLLVAKKGDTQHERTRQIAAELRQAGSTRAELAEDLEDADQLKWLFKQKRSK